MQLATTFRRLGRNDLRLIGRDPFLLYLFVYINAMAIALRFVLPSLDAYLAARGVAPLSLAQSYPMIVAYVLIFLGAGLIGMIFGFVLLEEKDDNTITAMLVTPLPFRQYMAYRVGVPTGIAFFEVIAAVLITNVARPQGWQLALIAAGASFTAPIVGLYLAAFAENKVQGLALTKFVGAAGFLILLAWFTPEPLQFLIGVFPPYWIGKAYWMALDGNPVWLAALALGVVLQAVMIVALAGRFGKVIHSR